MLRYHFPKAVVLHLLLHARSPPVRILLYQIELPQGIPGHIPTGRYASEAGDSTVGMRSAHVTGLTSDVGIKRETAGGILPGAPTELRIVGPGL
jgi:hypothetical protein